MSAGSIDLFDAHPDAASCETQFRQFGGTRTFSGPISTVRCHEDNVLLRAGVGARRGTRARRRRRGSFGCALLGDNIAGIAVANGWADRPLRVRPRCRRPGGAADRDQGARNDPRPSGKSGAGDVDVPVTFGGAEFAPGAVLHADDDGVIVLARSTI